VFLNNSGRFFLLNKMDPEEGGNSGDDDTLEEGRVALHLLERQLKSSNSIQDDVSEGSSRQNGSRQSLMAERRLLDQQPRDTRLLLRKGSPLGLTLEVNSFFCLVIEIVKELDDRGLLEGGGVVPSYYTSLRQKNRRQLELQDRSSRMRQRGNEVYLLLYCCGVVLPFLTLSIGLIKI
jgi:hypothetical protein